MGLMSKFRVTGRQSISIHVTQILLTIGYREQGGNVVSIEGVFHLVRKWPISSLVFYLVRL
jgi:hypothetical protein